MVAAHAVALYPSIGASTSARAVGDEVRDHCTLSFEEVNWKAMAEYIATNIQPWQAVRMKVNKLIPKRVSKVGRKPTVIGKTITLPSNSTQREKLKQIWQHQQSTFTKEQQ